CRFGLAAVVCRVRHVGDDGLAGVDCAAVESLPSVARPVLPWGAPCGLGPLGFGLHLGAVGLPQSKQGRFHPIGPRLQVAVDITGGHYTTSSSSAWMDTSSPPRLTGVNPVTVNERPWYSNRSSR